MENLKYRENINFKNSRLYRLLKYILYIEIGVQCIRFAALSLLVVPNTPARLKFFNEKTKK